MKAVATGGEPPLLTPSEATMLAAYRAMDVEAREATIEMAHILARIGVWSSSCDRSRLDHHRPCSVHWRQPDVLGWARPLP
jgi:hypothetical protein